MALAGLTISTRRVGQSGLRKFISRFDWPLFVTIAILAGVGLANLYSATYRTPHSVKFEHQIIWITAGLGIFFALTFLDYRNLHRLAWLGLLAVIVAIIVVRVLGDPIKGSNRWLDLGLIRVQPSELAKIAVIIALARWFQDRRMGDVNRAEGVFIAFGLTLPVLLIAWQPDLGTAILVAMIVGSVCFLYGRNLWPITSVAVGVVAALPLLWERMHGYQKSRVLAFLDPSADPTGAGWHTQQSIFAVGSGRVSGKGYLNATQNHFNFLPEHWTDFPFSVWAEEWGFVGSIALLAVFGFLILWIVNVALNARDHFGSVICLGVAAMVFWHVIVNIAMVIGLAPVVGVTLPIISYGGSSVLTMFIGLGLVSSVSMRRHGF